MMDFFSMAVFILCLLLAGVGMLTTLVNLPGTWLVFIAVLISAVRDDFTHMPVWLLVLFFALSVLSMFLDQAAMLVGGRQFGAGKWGMLGAVLGGIIGLFIGNVVGFLVGPFVGAVVCEIALARKQTDKALKAGLGAFLGFLAGIGLKFGLAVGMTACWLYLMYR